MAGTTLQTLWRAVADELGPHQAMTTDSTPTGPDPGRWISAATLATDAPIYAGYWYRLEASPTVSGRVLFHEHTVGALALEVRQLVVLPTSTAFEIAWPLPIETTHGVTGLVSLLQQACRDVWFEDTIDVETVLNAYTYELSDQATWLDSEERVLGLLDPPVVAGYPEQPADWRYDGLSFQAGVPTLTLRDGYDNSGAFFKLRVLRPAYSLVSGSESTTGPSSSTDVVYADRAELVAVAKLHAYRYLATATHLDSEAERARFAALVGPQEAYVRASVRHYLPRAAAAPAAGAA